MKRSLYIVFSALFFTTATFAQDAEWSNAEKFRNRTAFTRVLGQNSSGIYTLRSKSRFVNRKVYVQMFRENMGQMYNKLLPGLKRAQLEDAFVYEHGLEVFKSKYSRKTRTINLIHQSYSIEAEPKGKEKVVMTSPQRDYSDEGDYILDLSNDKKKLLCFHTEIASNKNIIIEILILNAPDMTEIGRKRVELPFKYKRFHRLDFKVANNGNAYFIFRAEDDTKKKREFERFGYYLFAYDLNSNKLSNFYLNNKDTYLSRPSLSIDRLGNKVIVAGFYSLKNAGYSKGLLDFAIDATSHTKLYHSFIPYPQNFVADVIGKYAAERGEELRNLYVRKIVPHSDSGYLFVAEEFYTTTQTYTFSINGMMQVGSRDIFNYGKIAVLLVNKKGEIEWTKVINKNQSSSQDLGYYSSIYVIPSKTNVAIFYNDEDRGNSEVTKYTLDNNGNMDSELLFKTQNISIAVVPREAQQLDAATILFPAAKDRKFAFVKLMLN